MGFLNGLLLHTASVTLSTNEEGLEHCRENRWPPGVPCCVHTQEGTRRVSFPCAGERRSPGCSLVHLEGVEGGFMEARYS